MKSSTITKSSIVGYVLIGAVGLAAVAMAAVPAAGALTRNTDITAGVGSVISAMSTQGEVELALTPSGTGVQSTASDVVSVSSNNPGGYTLTIQASSAALTSPSGTIAAASGTQAAPAALGLNTWGYRVDGLGGFGAGPTTAQSNAAVGAVTYAALPTSAGNEIKSAAGTATNDQTTVWYSAAIDTDTPSDTYTTTVTYTAAVKG